MPHLSIEFSEGIERKYDMQLVCEKLFTELAGSPVFEASDIKVRAKPVAYFRIGTDPQTFVHATLLLMERRDEATRTTLNRTIIERLRELLPDVGSITVQDLEIERATYLKNLF
ncbi:5-carboxymethyl-2-hydroxymuconate isomerase [Rhizobium sp. AG855]|nr:5-carboxymethyl-2-hydroxymuconate isomerase [Rhizobium sp. AG855]